MKSSFVRGLAIVYAIVGAISTIILAVKLNKVSDILERYYDIEVSFASIIIAGIIGTVLITIILAGIAQNMGDVEYLNSKIYDLNQKINSSSELSNYSGTSTKNYSNSKLNLSSVSTKKDVWKCPMCSRDNLLANRTCKDCGYQK